MNGEFPESAHPPNLLLLPDASLRRVATAGEYGAANHEVVICRRQASLDHWVNTSSFRHPSNSPLLIRKPAKTGPKPAWGHVWMAPGCQGVLACCSFGRGSHVFGLCLYLPERDPKAAVVTPAVETAAIGPPSPSEVQSMVVRKAIGKRAHQSNKVSDTVWSAFGLKCLFWQRVL